MRKTVNLLFTLITAFYLCSFTAPTPVKTVENLKVAYLDEMNTSAMYTAYAQKATKDGYASIAKLFEAIAKAENIHATNHAKVLEKLGEKTGTASPKFVVKTTKENLMEAIKDEQTSINSMYTSDLAMAKQEKSNEGVTSISWAMDSEKKHLNLFQAALTALNSNNLKKLPAAYFVCPKCGNTFDAANVPAECDLCSRKQATFIKV